MIQYRRPTRPDGKGGGYTIVLPHGGLKALRGPCDCYSDMILRLAAEHG
jgi:hypothetical protein